MAAVPWLWFAVRLVGPEVDLFAVLLPAVTGVAVAVCAALAIVRRRPWYLVPIASLVLFTGVAIALPRIPRSVPEPVDPFVLVSANTFDRNPVPEAAARDLAARRPDVLVVVEVKWRIRRLLGSILPGYAARDEGSLAVFARWPLSPAVPIDGVPSTDGFRVTVERPGAPFDLLVLHLPNPLHEISFPGQLAMVERLLADVAAAERPVIVAGDLNASDRTAAYRALAGAMRDAMRSSWAGTTYQAGLFRLLELRIDHVFEPDTWCSAGSTTFPVPGSDHRGVSARLGPCP
ncbi:MAG: endonuclease/exonuclease/phosphatase family protein [Candidatus Velamenicoccus archaeovorus]